MEKRKLGLSDLKVSKLCLGTMDFGSRISPSNAFEVLDAARHNGINYLDTAEFYPVKNSAETYGDSERIVGQWMKQNNCRNETVVSSKMVGFITPEILPYIRNGHSKFYKHHIDEAINNSLQRLQTDYIDLYLLHWPDRNTIFFGEREFNRNREPLISFTPIDEILRSFEDAIKAGKIKYLGLSNENSWGICQFTKFADQANLPRIVTLSNSCNLLDRTFEIELNECCFREKIAFTPYSPMAMGQLTSKYFLNPNAEGKISRYGKDWSPRFSRQEVHEKAKLYKQIADKYNLELAHMSLAWTMSRNYVTSTIIGSTSLAQLDFNLKADESMITPEIESEINYVHLLNGDICR